MYSSIINLQHVYKTVHVYRAVPSPHSARWLPGLSVSLSCQHLFSARSSSEVSVARDACTVYVPGD